MFLHGKILKKGFILKGGFWFLIFYMIEKQSCFIHPQELGRHGFHCQSGKGSLELLDWQNEDPQPVCYVDGKLLEEDIQERIKLFIPTFGVDQDLLRENFFFVSRVSQPDAIEDFLSLELDENQLGLL